MKTEVLNHNQILRICNRFAFQIVENSSDINEILIIGIKSKGYEIAKIVKKQIENIVNKKVNLKHITIDKNNPQKLENLAIYVTNKDGLLVLDSRGLTLGTDMRDINEVESALSGVSDTTNIIIEETRGSRKARGCLLYTSPSPRDRTRSRMPSSA